MTSNINPNNINGAYPVAGQDNNSQGFRDNFTNTKTNFQYASDEITDLQNKAIVSSQLTGGSSLSTQNNMMNSPLSNALISGFSTPSVNLGTLSGNVTIDYSAGHYHTVTTGGNISLAFTNWPIAGQFGEVTVEVYANNQPSTSTPYTMTLPHSVNLNSRGITGLNWGNTNTMHFPAQAHYTFTFSTSNGGTDIRISENNTILQPFNGSNETLTNGQGANLGVTTSYIPITGTDQYFTLADGVRGQIKVFAAVPSGVLGGNSTITVTNAAWGTGGAAHVVLNAEGDSVVLQHGVGRWYVIGGNGMDLLP